MSQADLKTTFVFYVAVVSDEDLVICILKKKEKTRGSEMVNILHCKRKMPRQQIQVPLYLQTFKTLQNAFQNTAKTSVKKSIPEKIYKKNAQNIGPFFFYFLKSTIKALPDTHQMMRMETHYWLGRLW